MSTILWIWFYVGFFLCDPFAYCEPQLDLNATVPYYGVYNLLPSKKKALEVKLILPDVKDDICRKYFLNISTESMHPIAVKVISFTEKHDEIIEATNFCSWILSEAITTTSAKSIAVAHIPSTGKKMYIFLEVTPSRSWVSSHSLESITVLLHMSILSQACTKSKTFAGTPIIVGFASLDTSSLVDHKGHTEGLSGLTLQDIDSNYLPFLTNSSFETNSTSQADFKVETDSTGNEIQSSNKVKWLKGEETGLNLMTVVHNQNVTLEEVLPEYLFKDQTDSACMLLEHGPNLKLVERIGSSVFPAGGGVWKLTERGAQRYELHENYNYSDGAEVELIITQIPLQFSEEMNLDRKTTISLIPNNPKFEMRISGSRNRAILLDIIMPPIAPLINESVLAYTDRKFMNLASLSNITIELLVSPLIQKAGVVPFTMLKSISDQSFSIFNFSVADTKTEDFRADQSSAFIHLQEKINKVLNMQTISLSDNFRFFVLFTTPLSNEIWTSDIEFMVNIPEYLIPSSRYSDQEKKLQTNLFQNIQTSIHRVLLAFSIAITIIMIVIAVSFGLMYTVMPAALVECLRWLPFVETNHYLLHMVKWLDGQDQETLLPNLNEDCRNHHVELETSFLYRNRLNLKDDPQEEL